MKLGFYTVPTRNQTLGRCMAVYYKTAVPRQHHLVVWIMTQEGSLNIFIKIQLSLFFLGSPVSYSRAPGLIWFTVEPLLRGHSDEWQLPLERPLDNENLNIDVLISTPDKRPPLLKGHFSDVKGVASQEGFHWS